MTRYRMTNVLTKMVERKYNVPKGIGSGGWQQMVEEIAKEFCCDRNGPFLAWKQVKKDFGRIFSSLKG